MIMHMAWREEVLGSLTRSPEAKRSHEYPQATSCSLERAAYTAPVTLVHW